MQLFIANKLYSSWSLRPWLLMTALGIPFEERLIPMYLPDRKARMLDVSPAGKMPCLIDGEVKVWESLAILEYLHERFPDAGVWPQDPDGARPRTRPCPRRCMRGSRRCASFAPMNLGQALCGRAI